MNNLLIKLPEKYDSRMEKHPYGDGKIRVFADEGHRVTLGVVNTQDEAVRLLDGFDKGVERRNKIAELRDKDLAGNQL